MSAQSIESCLIRFILCTYYNLVPGIRFAPMTFRSYYQKGHMNSMKSLLLLVAISLVGLAVSLYACLASSTCPPATVAVSGQCEVVHPE